MKKRLLSLFLVLMMCLTILPSASSAQNQPPSSVNYFPIFTEGTSPPQTQEALLQEMLQHNNFYFYGWRRVGDGLKPTPRKTEVDGYSCPYRLPSSSTIYYTNQGMDTAIENVFGERKAYILNHKNMPKIEDMNKQVFYMSDTHRIAPTQMYTPITKSAVFFYDFQVKGLPDKFETPQLDPNDTETTLNEKNIIFNLGGASKSFTVTAVNPNDEESVVSKSYEYTKSQSAQTSVSTAYSEDWNEETTASISVDIPVINIKGGLEQSFSYSYGMTNTYGNSKDEGESQTVTDTLQQSLPAHTQMNINVQVLDRQTKIPYSGAAQISCKVLFAFAGYDEFFSFPAADYYVCNFGRNGLTAAEDLAQRVANRDVPGYNDEDIPHFKDRYDNNKDFMKTGTTQVLSYQPYAPYFGDFHYIDKTTVITPREIQPLYPLDNIAFDVENITLHDQQTKYLDSISIKALNQYDVPYYGFKPALDGQWKVVDAEGNDASAYAQVANNPNNQRPYLKTLKATDREIFLIFEPTTTINKTKTFKSNRIPLTIKGTPLSDVAINGTLEPIIFNDSGNTASVSGLTVTAKDENGNPFDTAERVTWKTDATEGLTINPTTGAMAFTKPGDYQIYAEVNGEASNRVLLQVLPARQLASLTVTGTIPELYYNSDTENNFNLSNLAVEAKDQYGEDYQLKDGEAQWKLTPPKATTNHYAELNGNILTGKVVGSEALHLEATVGEEVIKSNPLTVTVGAKPYITKLLRSGDVPEGLEGTAYDLSAIGLGAENQFGKPFILPQDIQWKVSPRYRDGGVTIDDQNKLTVAKGTIPYGKTLKVPVYAATKDNKVKTKDIFITFRQVPQLDSLLIAPKKSFDLLKDQNGYLSDYFSVTAKDQYGKPITASPQWKLEKDTGYRIDNGIITVLETNAPNRISAYVGAITSNKLPLGSSDSGTFIGGGGGIILPPVEPDNPINAGSSEGGKVSLSPEKANAGEKVTIQVQPDQNYELARILVTDRQGNTLAVTEENGSYTFIMPDSPVNIDARFQKQKVADAVFTDVPEDAYYADAVKWAVTNGITAGETDTTFAPDADCTRAQAVTFLWRAAGSPEPTTTDNPFVDVTDDTYYTKAVLWAVEKGITSGIDANHFAPNSQCNREQIVTFMWRAQGEPAIDTENTFTDVSSDAYYNKAVLWAVEKGITFGTSANTFSPNDNCNRAQIVTFLHRLNK